jgi:hypothetical protein
MIGMSLICLLFATPIHASAGGQNVEETMLCCGADNTTVVLELWKPSQFGVDLHCLNASFASQMMACAPQGGWGLGRDDDMVELVDVTNDWNTAHNHEEGKVIASAGKRGVRFTAHAGKGISSNMLYRWKFVLERSSGKATWFGTDGNSVAYECETVVRNY